MGATPPQGWEPWRPGAPPAPLPGLAPVVGHRGAAAHAPENTLASIRRARALGAGWVEFDVRLTADGVAVLLHDETLDRTTDGRGPVAQAEAATVRGLDAAAAHKGHPPEPLPTLRAALELALELGLGANVEVKACAGVEGEGGGEVAREVMAIWPASGGPPPLLSSFSIQALRAARAAAPGLPLGLLVERVPRGWAELMADLGCTTLHAWHRTTGTAAIGRLAAEGVPVLLYTVNDGGRAGKLLAAGARAVITDAPDRILPALAPGEAAVPFAPDGGAGPAR